MLWVKDFLFRTVYIHKDMLAAINFYIKLESRIFLKNFLILILIVYGPAKPKSEEVLLQALSLTFRARERALVLTRHRPSVTNTNHIRRGNSYYINIIFWVIRKQ
jgi:hypothetical protein